VHDQAADGRAEKRSDEGRDDDEVHRPQQFALSEGSHDRQSSDRRHEGRAGALKNSSEDHLLRALGQSAQDRRDREYSDRGGEDLSGPVAIRHPSAHRDADGQAQNIARSHCF